MSESVNFQKQVFSKGQYTQVIDTSFKELGVQSNTRDKLIEQPTCRMSFLSMYNEFIL
jgi:hypothetical protein